MGNHRSMYVPDEIKRQSGVACRVYTALAEYCDSNGGSCFPSLSKIAKDVGVSPRTVCRALTWLEAQGHVGRQRRRNGEEWTSTMYRLPAQDRSVCAAQGVMTPVSQVMTPVTQPYDTSVAPGYDTSVALTHTKLTPTNEHSSAVVAEKLDLGEADASPEGNLPVIAPPRKPWDVAYAAIVEEFPDALDKRRCGFAGELVKVAKRSATDPTRLARLAAAVIRLHGVTLDTLTHASRSALVCRLDSLLALTPTDRALEARWRQLSGKRGWPEHIGYRVERLISQWNVCDTPDRSTNVTDHNTEIMSLLSDEIAKLRRPPRSFIAIEG